MRVIRFVSLSVVLLLMVGCQHLPELSLDEVRETAATIAIAARDEAIQNATEQLEALREEDVSTKKILRRAGGTSLLALALATLVCLLRRNKKGV